MERIPMSEKDFKRLEILNKVKEGRCKQVIAGRNLGISTRQIRRLVRRLEKEGSKGVISKKIGMPGNHRLSFEKRAQVVAFCRIPEHSDFGPTLTQEYLLQGGGPKISVNFVRKTMIQEGLWHPKRTAKKRAHPLRPRRARRGELIQLDGSEHDWFEGRGSRCSLLVFIDDATSETLHLKFVKSENLLDYFKATREYIEKCGRPEAFYPDKHSVFRVNREGALSGDGMTQFGRAMKELDIELICANTPQAKGRVERRNRDFQDRLVKAMRIARICTIEAANAFLPSFLDKFNQQFAKAPQDPIDAHRPLSGTHKLDRIFCIKAKRHLSKNLTLQHENVIYQVLAVGKEYTLRKAEVTVLKTKDGSVSIEYRGKTLTAVPYHKIQARTEEVSSKELLASLVERKKGKFRPGRHHPWKQGHRGFSRKAPPLASCY
jgi:DNA-binding Lrp family transcriptional regulator